MVQRKEDLSHRMQSKKDGTDQLCELLYGRKASPRDYLGGSEAQMLFDAVAEIENLRRWKREVKELFKVYEEKAEDQKEKRSTAGL